MMAIQASLLLCQKGESVDFPQSLVTLLELTAESCYQKQKDQQSPRKYHAQATTWDGWMAFLLLLLGKDSLIGMKGYWCTSQRLAMVLNPLVWNPKHCIGGIFVGFKNHQSKPLSSSPVGAKVVVRVGDHLYKYLYLYYVSVYVQIMCTYIYLQIEYMLFGANIHHLISEWILDWWSPYQVSKLIDHSSFHPKKTNLKRWIPPAAPAQRYPQPFCQSKARSFPPAVPSASSAANDVASNCTEVDLASSQTPPATAPIASNHPVAIVARVASPGLSWTEQLFFVGQLPKRSRWNLPGLQHLQNKVTVISTLMLTIQYCSETSGV